MSDALFVFAAAYRKLSADEKRQLATAIFAATPSATPSLDPLKNHAKDYADIAHTLNEVTTAILATSISAKAPEPNATPLVNAVETLLLNALKVARNQIGGKFFGPGGTVTINIVSNEGARTAYSARYLKDEPGEHMSFTMSSDRPHHPQVAPWGMLQGGVFPGAPQPLWGQAPYMPPAGYGGGYVGGGIPMNMGPAPETRSLEDLVRLRLADYFGRSSVWAKESLCEAILAAIHGDLSQRNAFLSEPVTLSAIFVILENMVRKDVLMKLRKGEIVPIEEMNFDAYRLSEGGLSLLDEDPDEA